MDEINEIPKASMEFPSIPEVPVVTLEYKDALAEWKDFSNEMADFYKSLEVAEAPREVMEAREYGVSECAEVAKECFTPEVIQNWTIMDVEQRNVVIQEYAHGIGEGMGIDFKGIVWEAMDEYTYGYNSGDGYVHLNVDMLANPAQLMFIVDTVAHEARHQMQFEAMQDPEKFPIDEASITEWTVANAIYTLDAPSAYDPWGYTYNPMEIDARYFGEAMVRELTKDIINNA